MTSYNGNSLVGCRFEPAGLAAPSISFAATRSVLGDPTLPASVDLRPHCTSVEDQGRTNSCTANAVVGAMEYHLAKRDGGPTDLSRLFVYFNTRRLNGTIDQDGGARISEAMAAALAYGACRAELWPYDVARMAEQPPQPAYLDGLGHEAMQYARVPGVEGAVRALAEGLPVVFGCFLPQRCYDEAARTGRIPATRPEERGAPPQFGHAMLLVGYDLGAKEFIVRNSWGPGWGDSGYCRLPFEEAAYFSPTDGFWVLASLEAKQSFKVTRPDDAAARSGPAPALSDASPSAVFGAPLAEGAGHAAEASVKSEIERMKAELRGDMASRRAALSSQIAGLRGGARALGGAAKGDLKSACGTCNGSGVCFYCGGVPTRRVRLEDPIPPQCGHCHGSLRCNSCGGSGYFAAPDQPTRSAATNPTIPKTKREPLGDWKRCQQCNGSGACYYCRGSGVNMGYPCSACNQTRACSYCGGWGKV